MEPINVNLLQADGRGVGQSVPDLHVHIIPRRPDATLKLNWQYKAGDMAEIKAVYEELKAAR